MALLDGRVVIVTGGAQGIGRVYCLAVAREGAALVVADTADPTSTVEEIRAGGGRAIGVIADVSQAESADAMASAADTEFGRIDVLINNAAFFKKATVGPFTDIAVEEWDLCFDVNVRGVWLCCRAVYPYMKAQGSGKIINVSSCTVWKGVPGFLHYVASKSALVGLTRALAREVGDDGITVNTLVPDLVPDDEIRAKQPRADEMAVAQRCIKRTQTADDMVGAALFLSGPGSDFVTGQAIHVNGGIYFH